MGWVIGGWANFKMGATGLDFAHQTYGSASKKAWLLKNI